jgi:hypothetical protein
MARKTMKMLVVALIAAFALSSIAEAAAPKKTRHRAKHSSRVASGGPAVPGKGPAAKKAPAKSRARAKTSRSAQKPAVKKAPAKRRPPTKPR